MSIGMKIDLSQPASKEFDGKSFIDKTILEDLIACKKNRDVRLRTYLFATWDMAPDCPGLDETYPSWDVLCDLLSEDWVLSPEENLPES